MRNTFRSLAGTVCGVDCVKAFKHHLHFKGIDLFRLWPSTSQENKTKNCSLYAFSVILNCQGDKNVSFVVYMHKLWALTTESVNRLRLGSPSYALSQDSPGSLSNCGVAHMLHEAVTNRHQRVVHY